VVVQAGVHDKRAEHQLGDHHTRTRRGAAHQRPHDAAAVYDQRIRILRWRPESNPGGGDAGRRRDVACVLARPPGASNQVRQVLVLVLLVRRRRGARRARGQGNRRPRLGRGHEHPAGEACLEPHGHDEQLLVPGEDQRVPAAQGRDRHGVRAPGAAGQPAGRLD
ncbi:hypothetical protein ACJX0J_026650, partial [Zea mays]